MKNDKYHCPKCKLLFDSMNHLPRILPTCSHSICSYCINEQLQQSEKNVICPIDNILYEKISGINFFKENQNLISELQDFLNIPKNHNYEISHDEEIFFDKSGIMNSDKFNDTMNSLNLNSSLISSSHCYYKKAKDIRNILLEKNNNKICQSHSLPLNIICIEEKKKICSQCALNNEHVNHQIMTETEFMNNIDNLIDIFQEVDNKQIKYLNFNNVNTKQILDKINNNIDDLIKMINTTKADIINRIKEQCEEIEKYLNKRKEEIFNKYQSTNFDISTLRESTLNWMQIVTSKLDKLNEIKEPSVDCIKLIDDDQNKNVFNLIRNGKQLNGRFNFIQETIKIIDKLEKFDKSGINIKPNDFIINKIFFKKNENGIDDMAKKEENDIDINLNINEEEGKMNKINKLNEEKKDNNINNIKSSLFEINENNELINSLHLTQYKFELLNNNDITQAIKEEKNISEKNNNNKSNEIKDKENNKSNNNSANKEHDNDIMLNLNIEEIKKENKNEEEIKGTNDNINSDKNNISKIIDDLSFNDDTLLINSFMLNQNDTVYHKKIKNDYPMDLKNQNRKKEKEKDKENSLKQNSEKNLIINVQKNQIDEKEKEKEKPKTITTKKIDLSELKNKNNANNKTQEEKINKKIGNKNTKNCFTKKNSFNGNLPNGSIDNSNEFENINNNKIKEPNPINVNVINNNKNEIVINFTKKISATKNNNKPVCSNYMKSEKKSIFGKFKTNGENSPIMMSRSPGRMNCQSKLAGFYSFVPIEKINQKQNELNQYKNVHKTLMSSKDFTDIKNKIHSDKNIIKNNKNLEEENDINNEYPSNSNIKRNTFVNKFPKKIKSKNEFPTKIIKKLGSSKFNSKENIFITNKDPEKYNNLKKNTQIYVEHYNTLNNPNQNQISTTINNSTNNIQINTNNNNNNNNSFETKSKKDLQEIVTNQLKSPNPNFSRINMNGFGIQYLCSFLHKNPNYNYKEIKLLGCNINDDDLFMLTRTLLDHEIDVLILNLSSNKITDDSASNILDILKDCNSLKGLSLYNNLISNLLKDKLKEYVKLGRENNDMVQLYI